MTTIETCSPRYSVLKKKFPLILDPQCDQIGAKYYFTVIVYFSMLQKSNLSKTEVHVSFFFMV